MSKLLKSGMVGDNFSRPWMYSKDIPKKAILKVKDWKRKKDAPDSEPVKTIVEIDLLMTSVEIKGGEWQSNRYKIPVLQGVFTTERDINKEIKEQLAKESFFIPVRTINER